MGIGKTRHEVDMTTGSILPKIMKFALPLMATSVLQLLFNTADMMVVGQFVGDIALAAVGATSNIVHIMVNFFIGLSVGAGVVMARRYGAKNEDGAKELVHTAMPLSLLLGVCICVLGIFFADPLLRMLDTPENVFPLSSLYLKIYFMGAPFLMIYNFGASILRAIGDTVRPLIYLTIAGIMNVAVNIVTVTVFNMGVEGVAYATVTSQAVSAVLVLICMLKEKGYARFEVRKSAIRMQTLGQILKMGVPSGIQTSLTSVSSAIIQKTINGFGDVALAGNTAAQNVEAFAFVIMAAVASAAATAVGQNYGAGNMERIKKAVFRCLICSFGVFACMFTVVYLLREPLILLFVKNPQSIEIAKQRIVIVCGTCFMFGLIDVLTQSMRGMGFSTLPMLITLVGTCVLRVVWVYTLFPLTPVYGNAIFSYPVSWIITLAVSALVFIFVFALRKKQIKRLEDMK